MKKLLYILVTCFTLTSCQAQQKEGVELIKPAQFEKQMEQDRGQVIDVRTPREYSGGYIANAVNMHLYDNDFEQRLDTLDKKKTVYVYCKVGGRSAEAVEIMQQKGFIHIVELEGGMDAWTEAGMPVKK